MTATAGDEGRILVTRRDVAWLAGRDLSDIVANNRAFDAVWYAARNADSIAERPPVGIAAPVEKR